VKAKAAARTYLPPVAVLVGAVAIWQATTTLGHVAATVLPGPRLVATATWDDRANLWPAITTTTEESVLGIALAVVVAFLIGIAIDWSRTVRGSVYPLIVVSQTLPIIALAPMVVIWFGFGWHPKIVLVALFTFFPIVVGLVQGLASADPDAIRLARTMRATRLQLLLKVRLPGALPQLFTGLKIAVTYAFTSATVAEWVGATQGLGYYITNAERDAPVEPDLALGATVVVAVLTIALFLLVGLLQRLAMPWRPRRPT
jgi:ABC-type nitrate/sulfonate/bicarbonate transport system permease component